MSKNICESCQQCRLTKAKLMKQIMGKMPPERFMPSPPFTSVVVDYFGPYSVRGEVQKRITGKAWGWSSLICVALLFILRSCLAMIPSLFNSLLLVSLLSEVGLPPCLLILVLNSLMQLVGTSLGSSEPRWTGEVWEWQGHGVAIWSSR